MHKATPGEVLEMVCQDLRRAASILDRNGRHGLADAVRAEIERTKEEAAFRADLRRQFPREVDQ